MPNSYEFFWNTSPKSSWSAWLPSDRFWSKDMRKEKAAQWGLTPTEVYTLASIVEKETNQNAEKRRIAGVYLNRLRIGMRLQAILPVSLPPAISRQPGVELPQGIRLALQHLYLCGFTSPVLLPWLPSPASTPCSMPKNTIISFSVP
ncbi:MAG: endolytic transglycosylase MltG [Saprospirales bacterium]|nr:endolytic transglycosylase MltG [Saprospirales bacterium]